MVVVGGWKTKFSVHLSPKLNNIFGKIRLKLLFFKNLPILGPFVLQDILKNLAEFGPNFALGSLIYKLRTLP